MSRILFELCGKDRNNRFSPYCLRTRLALCQKGLSFKSVPTTFLEKDQFAPSKSKTVPVLKEGETWLADSNVIANYLEETYPDKPTLFGGQEGRAYSRFFTLWCDGGILPKIFVLIAPDIHKCNTGKDADYFYETRSKRVGMPLEELIPLREKNLDRLTEALLPVKKLLSEQIFISGDQPLYPDYVFYSAVKWSRLCSPYNVFPDQPEIEAWLERMENFYRTRIVDLEGPPFL